MNSVTEDNIPWEHAGLRNRVRYDHITIADT